MVEVRCKYCNNNFPAKSKKCPHCGRKRVKKGRRLAPADQPAWIKNLGIAVVTIVFIVGASLVVIYIGSIKAAISNIIPHVAPVTVNNEKNDEISTEPSDNINDLNSTPESSPIESASELPSEPVVGNGNNNENPSGGDEVAVNNNNNTIMISSLKLDKDDMSFNNVGENYKLKLTVEPENAAVKIIWKSTNSEIATVDESGLVTAVSAGTVNVSASIGGKIAVCIVRVNVKEKAKESFSLNFSDVTLSSVGETLQLTVVSNPTGSTTVWNSSNSEVAKVSQSGVVTVVGNGTANIMATSEDSSANCIVRVWIK